jgi:hypothetical protein
MKAAPAAAEMRKPTMDLQTRLDVLLFLLREIGVTVRQEPLGGESGGFCVVRGRQVLFVDTMADLEERYERTLSAVALMPEIDQRYLPPEVREDLERQGRRGE